MVNDILNYIKPAFVEYLNNVMENKINFISLKESKQDGLIRTTFSEITVYSYEFEEFAKILIETVKDEYYIYDLNITTDGYVRFLYAIRKDANYSIRDNLRRLEESLADYKDNITILPSSIFPPEYALFSQSLEYSYAKERKEDYLRMLKNIKIAKEAYQKALSNLSDEERLKLELDGE